MRFKIDIAFAEINEVGMSSRQESGVRSTHDLRRRVFDEDSFVPTNSVLLHTARKIFIYLLTYLLTYLFINEAR